MDRVELPLPSLHWYAAFSGLSLFYVLMYGITSPAGLLSSLWNDLWCLAVGAELHTHPSTTCSVVCVCLGNAEYGMLLPLSAGQFYSIRGVW